MKAAAVKPPSAVRHRRRDREPDDPDLHARRAGTPACLRRDKTFQEDPYWKDLIPFYEFYHGDDGAGLGASHQTGWSALVAALIEDWRR